VASPESSLARVPAVAVSRVASRFSRGWAQPAIGGISVVLVASKVGAISPKQIKVYEVLLGEQSLILHFLGGLRRSRKLYVPLAEDKEGSWSVR